MKRKHTSLRSASGIAVGVLLLAVVAATQSPALADGTMAQGATKVMTLSNQNGSTGLQLDDVVTIAFDDGRTPVGGYFDIWFCPDTSIAPVSGGIEGDCEAVTFWERVDVTNVEANAGSRAVKANELRMTWVFGTDDSPAYFTYPSDEYLDADSDSRLVAGIDADDYCSYVGWYLVVHDYDEGDHSNFLGPLGSRGCDPVSTYVSRLAVSCTPDPAIAGGLVTCEVSGGDAGIDILWQASIGSSFASAGVTLDGFGRATFTFRAPSGSAGQTISVTLVDWGVSDTVLVTAAPVPNRLPAGGGPNGPAPALLVAGLVLASALALSRLRSGSLAS
jgi:hypothetical protein